MEGAVEEGGEFCELAKDAEILGRGGLRVLRIDAVADKRILEVGPAGTMSVSVHIVSIEFIYGGVIGGC